MADNSGFTWLETPNSSQITRVGYNELTEQLRVEFKSTGRVYHNSVEMAGARSVAEAIHGAASPGKYFNASVARQYGMRPTA